MKKKLIPLILAIVVFIFGQQNLYSQQTCEEIQITIPELGNTKGFLTRYYGEKLYISDSAQANQNGLFTFNRAKGYEAGMYAFAVDKKKLFDLVANEKKIAVEAPLEDSEKHIKIISSKENEIFYEYVQFLAKQKAKRAVLQYQFKSIQKEEEKISVKLQLANLNKDVELYQRQLVKDNPGTLTGKSIWMSLLPELPQEMVDENGKPKDFKESYYYKKKHFFDSVDFEDPRLLRVTNGFHAKLLEYFDQWVSPSADSIILELEKLMTKVDKDSEFFKYIIHTLTFKYQSPKVMCQEKVFVHLGLTYYKAGLAHWAPEKQVKRIIERAEEMSPILCGNTANNITLTDTSGNWQSLHDLKADYTVLVFWSPDCAQCQKEMPRFEELYKELSSQNVKLFGVVNNGNQEWKTFIAEKGLTFMNVAIPEAVIASGNEAKKVISEGKTDSASLRYHDYFDIYGTPKVFLLDANKRILGKQLTVEQLKDFISKLKNSKQ